MGSKEINHPELAHLLFDYLSLNINNNKKFWDLSKSDRLGTAGFGP
jgi:hypothetical protein